MKNDRSTLLTSEYQHSESAARKVSVGLLAAVLMLALVGSHAQSTATLQSIIHSQLPGDDVQIDFISNVPLEEPGTFSTSNPARISLDFYRLKKGGVDQTVNINTGKVESVTTVETADRTRIIINLVSSARYQLARSEKGYSITIFNENGGVVSDVVSPRLFERKPEITSDTNFSGVDFRRTPAGGGKLEVTFSGDVGVVSDTRKRGDELIVDLLGVNLSSEHEKRLDVVDFATPVETVDIFQNKNNVRMILKTAGAYQHISYQSGDRFTLEVDPIDTSTAGAAVIGDDGTRYTGERLSINLQKIDVRSALTVIADFTGINFVTSDSVGGQISINLQDVPWDQALEVILKTKGLAQRRDGDVIWVAPASEVMAFEESQLKAARTQSEFVPLITEVVRINYARAVELAGVIRSVSVVSQGDLLSASGISELGADQNVLLDLGDPEVQENTVLSSRGSVTVDQRTNSLIISDTPDSVRSVKRLIAELDQPVRQVLIETRIVEATDSFTRELGARFGFQRVTNNAKAFGSNDAGSIIGSGTTEGATTISEDNQFDVSRNTPGGLSVDLGANGIGNRSPASYAFNIFKAGSGYSQLITLELSALEADGRGKIVASPRLVTSNQRTASISQGEERIFRTANANTATTTREEAELAFEVTPQITPDNQIIMDIVVTQDAFVDAGSDAIRTKELETQVLAGNGETIIIGGIYQENATQSVTRVPFLGKLPVIGNFFKTKSKLDTRTELIIFVTPKIISPELNLG